MRVDQAWAEYEEGWALFFMRHLAKTLVRLDEEQPDKERRGLEYEIDQTRRRAAMYYSRYARLLCAQ